VELLVLGSVEVRRPAGVLALSGVKQRSALALLVLRLNRVVAVDQFIDQLYGEDVPSANARGTVQRLMSRLRHLIDAGTSAGLTAKLEARAGGYRLLADPAQVDVCVFDRLAQEGREALAAEDFGRAVALLRDGLAVWRGPALSGVVERVREAPAARLEEARLLVWEDCIEAGLALGDHERLVAELGELVALHPLRERLVGQLMVALYRSGRQGDALRVYRHARQRLIEELGLEPSEALQAIHRDVLSGTILLARPLEQQNNSVSPAQLPADVRDFTGRGEQIRQLCEILGANEDEETTPFLVSSIGGSGGVGKTALAVHVGHMLREGFPDGQLYVNLRGVGGRPVSPEETLAGFLRALGVADTAVPDELDKRAALYRSVLAGRRALILLDNARDAAQVRPLLPGSASCRVLVTSRARLAALEGAHLVDLDVLPEPEAVDLLARVAGRNRIRVDPEGARAVVLACGNLPLAVRIAGARLAARPGWSVRTLANRLTDHRFRLDELQFGDLAVRASFELSYFALSAGEACAMRLLGILDNTDIDLSAAAALLDEPVDVAERTLEHLVDAYLLETRTPSRYQLHDLTAIFARERAAKDDSEAVHVAALERLLRYYVAVAQEAHQTVSLIPTPTAQDRRVKPRSIPFSGFEGGIEWLQTEHANIVNTIHQAMLHSEIPAAVGAQLVESTSGFFIRGYWVDWERAAEAVLTAAEREGDLLAEATARRTLGILAAERRYDLELASRHLGRCWELHRGSGDVAEAQALANLAIIYIERRMFAEALEYLQYCLSTWQALGIRQGESSCLNNIGNVYGKLGRYAEAVENLHTALKIVRGGSDWYLEASILHTLGAVFIDQARIPDGINYLHQSLSLCRRLQLRQIEIAVLTDLARAHRSTTALDEALANCLQALQAARNLGARYAEARALHEMGNVRHRQGEGALARISWREALDIFDGAHAPEAEDVRQLLCAKTGENNNVTNAPTTMPWLPPCGPQGVGVQ
jgi:DNA-binding SARP family transcriptional activator/tetratricopeptide (TPR) repeat protein